ncbi:TOBE domain-containing protein [Kocuria rhizophila]|uniref:TOBE domain-containing protein n=1 Tax=Kocuria rhizophila TaxID=72000 RepID=UPI001EF50971|nr:helix-turn-helix transcriptional regulator [Kocuria rhizophila]MCG7424186.1 helix-turn-helix transcriptional regulator [Kocuria rhizophila]MCT1456456.1 helix-turn-helix transcriptional regulator [Kocuria rhizophila]MCT1879273.1 helix-turn-helix transcriptional regulator [Kocuria rhizophila]MCT2249090.1 helix-turn-helix transcriptional regulator [Kocuria rhizophila]
MTFLRVAQAASFMGVSDDTVRRWIDQGALPGHRDGTGHLVVDGADLAELARRTAVSPEDPARVSSSARNRLVGLVTAVKSDPVMSQVELQCGPHRIVSLMSTEAVEDLGLEPGSVATAVVKSTAVIVETEGRK